MSSLLATKTPGLVSKKAVGCRPSAALPESTTIQDSSSEIETDFTIPRGLTRIVFSGLSVVEIQTWCWYSASRLTSTVMLLQNDFCRLTSSDPGATVSNCSAVV